MQIKKVITDPFFKKEYYKIENAILEKEHLENTGYHDILVDFNKAFLKADERVKANFSVKAEYRVFPSYDKMISMIDQKMEDIIEKLKLREIKCEHHKVVKSMVLAYYLVHHLNYDMTTKEFLQNNIDNYQTQLDKYGDELNNLRERYIVLHNKEMATGLDYDEQNEALHIFQHIINSRSGIDSLAIKAENSLFITLMFDSLIYNKGICSNFSYANDYILNKLGIKAYCLETAIIKGGAAHIFNIIEDNINGKTNYYVIDLTAAINDKKNGIGAILNNFGKSENTYLDKIVGVWERQNHIVNFEDKIYSIDNTLEKREKIKSLLSNSKSLEKQKNIAKAFIKVKLAKEEIER